MTKTNNPQLLKFENYLREFVQPIANQIDHDSALLSQAFDELKKLAGLDLFIPKNCGGLGWEQNELAEYNRVLAQYSGALLFLQAQHHYAVRKLAQYALTDKLRSFFNSIVEQQRSVSIFLADAKQVLNVEKTEFGFQLSGRLPWVSGCKFHQELLISFRHEDQVYYALLPFETNTNFGITCSEPMQTLAASSLNTVSITLSNYSLIEETVLHQVAKENKARTFPHPTIYNFAGVAQALLTEAEQTKHFQTDFIQASYQPLKDQLNQYIKKTVEPISNPQQLRAEGLQVARQCAEFARLVVGGRTLLQNSTVQRLYHELWLYSLVGMNPEQLGCYLKT